MRKPKRPLGFCSKGDFVDSPRFDELEISVFGPGRGECIVVHLGHNRWCVIDSCVDSGSSIPVSVGYLERLGKSAIEGVQLVVATHWHDDHIRGISNSLQSFPNSHFACSAAIQTPDFLRLVKSESGVLQRNSGVDEFSAILDILTERREKTPASLISPKWAMQNRSLLKFGKSENEFSSSVIALSPSDGTVKMAYRKIAELIPKPGEAQRRIPLQAPNRTSIALWIEVGLRKALLGADLEHTGHGGEGWTAVIDSFEQDRGAEFLKVPHHGSPNADCAEVWDQLLGPQPLAIITPFSSGAGLPQQSDLARLRNKTANLYCTALPRAKLPKREGMIERKLRTRERIAVQGRVGQVRMRCSATDPASPPRVELFNGAYRVS